MTTTAPRRFLVLTNESALHSFRASLPPHVFKPLSDEPQPEARNWRLSKRDWRQFLGAYCTSFVAVTAFIA